MHCLRMVISTLPEMLRPYAVAPGGENAVRIERVLDLLPHPAQRMVVIGIGVRDDVLEHRRRTVLGPAVVGGELHPFLEGRADLAVLVRVLRDREHDQRDERALPVRHEYGTDDPQVLAARDLGEIRAIEIAELEQLLAVARNDRREADVAAGGARLHRASPEHRECREIRDSEIYE